MQFAQFTDMYLQIAPTCADAELEEIENNRKTADHMFFETKTKYNELFPRGVAPAATTKAVQNPTNTNIQANIAKTNIHLPKLQFKTFDGDYRLW